MPGTTLLGGLDLVERGNSRLSRTTLLAGYLRWKKKEQ